MLRLSMTYEIVTEESAEDGDAAERGFEFQDAECSARELARYIEKDGFAVPSCSRGVPRWLSQEPKRDYMTGETSTRSIHPGRDAQSQKVWARVLKICGVY